MDYRIGIDVGSTTAKMVVMKEGNIIFRRYERHKAQVNELLNQFLQEVETEIGDVEASICVTGSVGMQTAELLQTSFVQEVVAAATYARHFHPEVNAIIDIGGEDSKVVLLTGGRTELRMNGNCAGGTGAFIDQMATLMGITNDEMNELALQSTHSYTIAARCGVFAKTDVQNLMSRNVENCDIAASIFHSVAVQTITTLAHGCQITPPVLLCGGPLTFLPALRHAFADYMHIDATQFIVSPDSNLSPAVGCALNSNAQKVSISTLRQRLQGERKVTLSQTLPPLFRNEMEWEAWRKEKQQNDMSLQPMKAGQEENVVIGIDSGSTTTKIIATRTNGDILFSYYAQSLGNPIKAVNDGLLKLKQEAEKNQTTLNIVGSCSTGYGEELIKAAFALDDGIIETMAHERAAIRLDPNVSFILDIGGQDMKAIFVENGVVVRMELNEACSSGCGTFLQTFAESLGYNITDFAHIACTAQHPCDLGTRCTVFMNSKIKQVLREGADAADISAGLSYSVVNNCLYKVLKLHDKNELGKHIVVQGGTMRNDAVVRALELLTGHQVARSNMPEMMGAYGCALHAIEHPSAVRSIEQLLSTAQFTTREIHCKGCENACTVSCYQFTNGNKYYSGNKCERVFTNSGKINHSGQNIYNYKYHLLFDRQNANSSLVGKDTEKSTGAAKPVIGIPRVLNMYENYPFWHCLLTDCGFEVVLSSDSTMPHYEGALCSVMSDNICFPAKLTHSHVEQLMKAGVDRILMPYVVFEHKESPRSVNSYNCPIVSGYSDVIKSAMTPSIPIDAPVINFKNEKLLKKEITAYLKTLHVPSRLISKAFTNALQAQQEYEQQIKQKALDILNDSQKKGQLTILLAGRPYHTDPLIQHRLSDMIAALGINVISEDIVRLSPNTPEGETNTVRQWAYVNRIMKAAEWCSSQPSDVQMVEMTSFGCGPDAFIQDEVRSLLRRRGKTLTLLKIDDVSHIGSLKLRVRSLVESLKKVDSPLILPAKEEVESLTKKDSAFGRATSQILTGRTPLLTKTKTITKAFHPDSSFRSEEKSVKILAPHISEFVTPLLPAIAKFAGVDMEILPPSDEESARIGLRYANNEVCYPATLIVGDIIKALQSGRYDLHHTAVIMSQTGGQCRATNYAGLIKRAMEQTGFSDVPLITLGVTTQAGDAKSQNKLDVPWMKILPILVNSLLFADAIAKMYYAAVVREKKEGAAAVLRDKYLLQAATFIHNKNANNLIWLLANAANEFNDITLDSDTKKVGVVGEIFLKFNHFAHQNLVDWLVRHHIEVVPPLISTFFLQEFVNAVENRRLGLAESHTPSFVVKMLSSLVQHRIRKFNAVASRYRYFRPFGNIWESASLTKGIVSPAAQFGEGWLLPAEMMEFAHEGVDNVLSLQPFGCIANHVVSKGIENAVRRRYPNMNLLSIDFDSGVSQVNVTNRILLFLSNI